MARVTAPLTLWYWTVNLNCFLRKAVPSLPGQSPQDAVYHSLGMELCPYQLFREDKKKKKKNLVILNNNHTSTKRVRFTNHPERGNNLEGKNYSEISHNMNFNDMCTLRYNVKLGTWKLKRWRGSDVSKMAE